MRLAYAPRMMIKRISTGFAFLALIFSTSIAHADQIDGTWCSPKGESMTIEGSNVVTPGGNKITANYDRHHVDYALPEGEENAGARLSADQLNDDNISVTLIRGGTAGAAVVWKRCEVVS